MDRLTEQIAREFKIALQELYGPRLAELVLFGSYARGDQHEESDVDFAIVLHSMDSSFTEIDRTSLLSSGLSLKYNRMVSTLFVTTEKK